MNITLDFSTGLSIFGPWNNQGVMARVRLASYGGVPCFNPRLIMFVGWKLGQQEVGSLILAVGWEVS